MTRLKLTMLVAASAMTLGLVACGEPKTPAADAAMNDRPDAAADMTVADNATTDFVNKMALSDMYEIESSRLALERSKVQAVKDYAQEMIDAHTATSNELKPLAASVQLTPPMGLDTHFTGKLDELRNASVEDFDDKYIDQQTEAHENAANLLRDYSSNGKNAELQAFASKTLPAVEAHLARIRALDDSPADDVTKAPS